jgi:hypothetical protein
MMDRDERVVDEALKNRGVYELRPALPAGVPRTLVVCGVSRSGTTMLVRMLHALGLFMGDVRKWRRNCEAPELYEPLEQGDRHGFTRQLRTYEREQGSFGFKRPDAVHHCEMIDACARSPHYVVAFRDMLAISLRNRLSLEMDLLSGLRDAWHRYGRVLDMVETSTKPCLLVSYEKAIHDPAHLAERLAAFAGLLVGSEQIEQAVACCRPGDPRYLLPLR